MKRLSGVVTPVITPFAADESVDYEALGAVIDFLIEKGVDGIFGLGTTGEAAFMSPRERMDVAEAIVRHVAGRVPVYIQVGAQPTSAAVQLARHAAGSGADGVAILTPYYYRYSPDALWAYYRDILSALPTGFPVYLYNLPALTGNDLLPSLVGRLAREFPHVVGIKNSMGDISRIPDYQAHTSDDFSILVGADERISPAMKLGAAGAVSGTSHVYPELLVALVNACRAGDWNRAGQLQQRVGELCSILHHGSDMAYFKAGLDWRGIPGGKVRRPFVDLNEDAKRLLFRELDALRERTDPLLPSGSKAGHP